MPVSSAGAGSSSSGGALGWACQADDLRDRPADLAALPVDGQLRHVERVEHALHLPARQERVDGVHVALDGDGGRLADLPDHAPGERLPQQRRVRQRRLAAGGQPGGRRLAGLGVRPGVVLRAQPRGEQPVELLQAGGRVPGRAPAVGVAGDLDQELLLDHAEHAFDLPPAHRAGRRGVRQLHAEHRARPLQRRVDERRPVIAVQNGRDAVGGDRGAEHAGEPDRVGAADEPGPGQEPGPVVDDAGQERRLPADVRAVHEVRGPDLVHRIGLEPAEGLRRLPARPGGQLAGLQPPLDGPQRRDGPALRGQDPADLRRGPGRVLHLQPGREVLRLRPEPRRALPRRRDQRARTRPRGARRPTGRSSAATR